MNISRSRMYGELQERIEGKKFIRRSIVGGLILATAIMFRMAL